MAEVVHTTAEGFRPPSERNGVHLVVEVPAEDTRPLLVDPDRLAQILANLIENALTYAQSLVHVALRVDHTTIPEAQIITVEDDGPGIAAADLERVFERFYQAEYRPNRQFGSGLGLAIVAELATAMGATVRAESPIYATGGSRFTVRLGMQEPAHP